jgi:putative mycofactocin binding protein MftB
VTLSAVEAFDRSLPWRLGDQVSLRDEAFGALAYHHGNRRLVFLKSRELVALVRDLDAYRSADEAIAAMIPAGSHDQYVKALSALARSEIISGR